VTAFERGLFGASALLAWNLLFATQALEGQGVRELATACGRSSETLLAWCRETALGSQSAQGALGLAASGGSEMMGSASTLGWRYQKSPRYALAARGSLTRFSMPGLGGGSPLPRGDASFTLPAVQAVVSMGLYNGFSPVPNVGGVLSVDLTGSAHLVFVPKDQGFRENLLGLGVGARLGILRESFNLPGVSVSLYHRSLGRSGFGSVEEGNPAEARFDVGLSSVRGIIGKDVKGVGLFGGTGWDRYRGQATIRVEDPETGAPGQPGVATASGKLTSDRRLFFLGGTLTYVILQISIEGGRAQGFGTDVPDRPGGDFDPSTASWFGSLGFRLTF